MIKQVKHKIVSNINVNSVVIQQLKNSHTQKYFPTKHKRVGIRYRYDQCDNTTLKGSPKTTYTCTYILYDTHAQYGGIENECNQCDNKAIKKYDLNPHKHCHYEL